MEIYTGDSIARQITEFGINCKFVEMEQSPQFIIYKFNLLNILQLQKINKIIQNLETLANTQIFFESGDNSCHFKLLFKKPKREFIKLTQFAKDIKAYKNKYPLIFGVDTQNKKIIKPLDELVHLLVAGTTGSGKSVAINNFILSLCCYNSTKKLGLILIDPKQVEFTKFEKLPHLLTEVVTEVEKAKEVLNNLIDEMEERYFILKSLGKVKNNGEFKKIVCVIDELADLILQDKEIKTLLLKLLQKGRASGIHLILGTQTPRATILDGAVLSNIPSRFILTTANIRESVLALGHKGAEKLLFKGDAILKTAESPQEIRIQTPYLTNTEIKKLIEE